MPALKAPLAAGLLAATLALGALLGPFLLDAPGSLRAAETGDLLAARLPPPPTLRLLSPEPGQGVGERARIAGEAHAERSAILDVQYRVDGAPWQSVPGVVAGAPLAPFSAEIPLPPGDHVLDVRAWDGNAHSLVARALVRAAPTPPPTLRILQPADGQGVAEGPVVVAGTLDAAQPIPVVVEAAGRQAEATVSPGPGGVATWTATLDLPAGLHAITARAQGALPARVLVAAGPAPPPTLRVLQPANGSAFGSGGADPCRCVPFAGVAPGAREVLVSLDGGAPEAVRLDAAGAWAWSLPMSRLLSGEHQALFTPLGEDGAPGVSRAVAFTVRSFLSVRVEGDDAPRPTHAPLRFRAEGEALREVRWTLDGAPLATGPSVELRLDTPGLHVLAARTLDAQDRAATVRVPLWAVNQLPTATLESPAAPVTGAATLVARGSDADGRVVAWRWDFGDGATATTALPEATHRWPHAGTWRVRATPVDDQGAEGAPASVLVPVLNAPPAAAFSFTPAAPTLQDVVTFTDESLDPERRLAARRWDFGDGHTAEGPLVQHRYATRGPHAVTLTVTDLDGGSDTARRTLALDNLLPAAAFVHEPQAIQTGAEVLFLDRSSDPDGRIVAWRWDFGHDCPEPCDALRARHANESRVLHAFPAPGVYTVTLSVLDEAGAAATRALDVHVADGLPLVRKVVLDPETLHARQEVRFRAVVDDPEGRPVALSWSFGDGNASTDDAPTHAYARAGLYEARVKALDAAGQESALRFPVLVHNAKPNATLRLLQSAFAGQPAHLDARASDPDGRIVRYQFDADGDGAPDCDGPSPRCVFTYPAPGTYPAHVAVADDEGASVRAELDVVVAPPPAHLAPPEIRVETPAPEAILAGRVLLQGSARGEAPIQRVEIQLRHDSWTLSPTRGPWTSATGNESWRLHLDTRAFADGAYDLVVRATDARNATGTLTVPVHFANGPRPSLVSVQLHNPPEAPLRAPYDLLGSAWHPDGPVHVRHQIDDGPWRDVSGDPVGFTLPLDPAALGPGPHLLRVDARRGAHERAETTLAFRVADKPPVLVVDEPPTPIAYGLLAASGRLVGEGKVLWRVDHDVWRELPPGPAWRLAHETQSLRNGPHDLWLKAASLDDVEQGEPVKYRVRVINPAGATQEDRRLLDAYLEESRRPDPLPGEVDLRQEARRDASWPLWAAFLALGATATLWRRR